MDLEKERVFADLKDLERIIAFFRQQGIPCSMEDLVEEVEGAELVGEET